MRQGSLIIFILVSAVLFWVGVVCFVSCSGKPENRAVEVAEKALMASVDNPKSVKILAISKADSVFGRDYVTMDEKMALSMAMMKINEKVMKETNGFENFNPDDKAMSDLMERQMAVMSALRGLIVYEGNPHGHARQPFNGWKVKIEFEAKDSGGKPYRSEYWFILDKEALCVVKSFEVPLM